AARSTKRRVGTGADRSTGHGGEDATGTTRRSGVARRRYAVPTALEARGWSGSRAEGAGAARVPANSASPAGTSCVVPPSAFPSAEGRPAMVRGGAGPEQHAAEQRDRDAEPASQRPARVDGVPGHRPGHAPDRRPHAAAVAPDVEPDVVAWPHRQVGDET